jgi:hypothetical protein
MNAFLATSLKSWIQTSERIESVTLYNHHSKIKSEDFSTLPNQTDLTISQAGPNKRSYEFQNLEWHSGRAMFLGRLVLRPCQKQELTREILIHRKIV